MAVWRCKEVTDRDANQDAEQSKRFVRTFQVMTDSDTDGAALVLRYVDVPGGLPKLYDPWKSLDADGVIIDIDPDCIVVERSARNTDPNNPTDWLVTIRYAGITDPTALPTEVEFSPVRYQVPLLKDLVDPDNPAPVLNSAGDPFQGGIMVDRTRLTLVLTKNVLTWDPVQALSYQDSVNQFHFLQDDYPPGLAAGTCKIGGIGATRIPRPGNQTFYYRRRVEIDIDYRGWFLQPLDAGYHFLRDDGAGGHKLQRIILPNGTTPAQPIPLDGHGKVLPDGDDPVYLSFTGYQLMDWSLLGIDPL